MATLHPFARENCEYVVTTKMDLIIVFCQKANAVEFAAYRHHRDSHMFVPDLLAVLRVAANAVSITHAFCQTGSSACVAASLR